MGEVCDQPEIGSTITESALETLWLHQIISGPQLGATLVSARDPVSYNISNLQIAGTSFCVCDSDVEIIYRTIIFYYICLLLIISQPGQAGRDPAGKCEVLGENTGEERRGENSPGNIPADSPAVLKICNDRKKAVPSRFLLLLRTS